MKRNVCFLFLTVLSLNLFSQNPIIIDHTSIDLSAIPSEWIDSAKQNLHIGYGHTSHGSHISNGMSAIDSFYTNGMYSWSNNDEPGKLHMFEGADYETGYLELDAGHTGWDNETREYLNSNAECNVIMWSWCGQVNDVDLTTHYFEPMESLELEYPNVVFVYMTGHLEGEGPEGSLFTANQQIRDYCTLNNKVLYDFADIEKFDPDALVNYQELYAGEDCEYDPDGEEPREATENWAKNWVYNNPTHELTLISDLTDYCAHSERLNCVKKGIAAWHLWARLAGWLNEDPIIPVADIRISTETQDSIIDTFQGQLQLYVNVLPKNASDTSVTWVLNNTTGEASIDTDGLVTAFADGVVEVFAVANDNSGVKDSISIFISNQVLRVTSIDITSVNGEFNINQPGDSLQLIVDVLPENATDTSVTWKITNEIGEASIDTNGLVIAIADGIVEVFAISNDGSGITDSVEINISNQSINVLAVDITSENGSFVINQPGDSLQLFASVTPENASDSTVIWEVKNGSGEASVNSSGLLYAISEGLVWVYAIAYNSPYIYDSVLVAIKEVIVMVESIQIISDGDEYTVYSEGDTLQLYANVLPVNASVPSIQWTLQNSTGTATINNKGVVIGNTEGEVLVKAKAIDGSGVKDSVRVSVLEYAEEIQSIVITSENGDSVITEPEGTLQLIAQVIPESVIDPIVLWDLEQVSGEASVDSTGLVTAISQGGVMVKAFSATNAAVFDLFEVDILYNSSNTIIANKNVFSIEGDILYLNLDQDKTGIVRIIDLNGRLISIYEMNNDKGNAIDLSYLESGIYIVHIFFEGKSYFRKYFVI